MTYDNFTIKAQESILNAQRIAADRGQQMVDSPHLIRGIMETDEDVTEFLLGKMGVNVSALTRQLDEAIGTYPKVEGDGKQYLSNDANKALSFARKRMQNYGDEYIS